MKKLIFETWGVFIENLEKRGTEVVTQTLFLIYILGAAFSLIALAMTYSFVRHLVEAFTTVAPTVVK